MISHYQFVPIKVFLVAAFQLKSWKMFLLFYNRNEGWSENNIPWWRGPRARTRTRGYYYCLGSKRPLCIYKVKTLEVLSVNSWCACSHASLVTADFLAPGNVSRQDQVAGSHLWVLMCAEALVQLVRAMALSVRQCTSGYLGPELRTLMAYSCPSFCPWSSVPVSLDNPWYYWSCSVLRRPCCLWDNWNVPPVPS